MGDLSKRHRLIPLQIGSFDAPRTASGERPPLAMLVTVNADAVPGFRKVLDRQRAGEEFDVTSRWISVTDRKGKPPWLVLDFYLPEVDLGIAIYIDVDESPRSIQAAIRTGLVVVLDPEASLQFHRDPSFETLKKLRVFAMRPPDPRPATGVLQQRHAFPRPTIVPEHVQVSPDDGPEAVAAFFADARPVSGVGVQINGDALSVIILTDPTIEQLRKDIPTGSKLEGSWALFAAGEDSAILFELKIGGERLARWRIDRPPDDVVLAGSGGVHLVALVDQMPTTGGGEVFLWDVLHVEVGESEALRELRVRP
ncbi:MAG TPA: hypothetical protein VFX45_06985 [Solirubrobacterales bacterium]|nr:hypothetical protein [Solirubrobacterales bacterium]